MDRRTTVKQPAALAARVPVVGPFTVLLALLAGCEDFGRRTPPPEPAPPPRASPASDFLVAGTIGAETLVANVDVQPLRGFGLVVGLNGQGSSDCPSVIRDYLIDFMTKEMAPQGNRDRKLRLSPSELVDSLDTAVVEVTGVVPAGARKGARFDLQVNAVLGTSTESLKGGLLLVTQMRFFDRAASGKGLVAGRVLAQGGGPLFTNPFANTSEGGSDADPRRGEVLGGGRALVERPFRLMLLRPNYRLAQSIERRVNERFGHKPRAAEAISAGYIELTTPPAFARQPQRFCELVAQLYLDNRPAVTEQKLRELARRAVAGGAERGRIAAAWEGIGRSVIAQVQPLYTHADPVLRFYAARTGLRLGDLTALPVLGSIAAAPAHSHRLLAVRGLGECNSPQTAFHLAPLVNDPDQEIRIAAYEALLQRGHPAIQSVTFLHLLDRRQINFILDVVDSDGPPLIYVRRTRLPRIAAFGSRMSVTPPVFYVHPDDTVMVHTVDGSDDIRLFVKRGGRMSEQIVIPPRVVDLITSLGDLPLRDEAGRLRGIGLPYSCVVQILAAMSQDETIPARIVLEQTSLTELLGPDVTPDRPEAERE